MTGKTLAALLDGTLDAEKFSHRDHVIVAYEALEGADFFTALGLVVGGIARLAASGGAAQKFNATITFAFVSLIAERMATTDHADAEDFMRCNPDLLTGTPLRRHYSSTRLASDLSRQVALLPDLAPMRQEPP
mgnify:CR=1 FL=1